jgi:hypothetical protein
MRQVSAVFRSPNPALRDCVRPSDSHLFRVFVLLDTKRCALSRYVPALSFFASSIHLDNFVLVTGPPEVRILLVLRGLVGFLGTRKHLHIYRHLY